MAEDTPARYDSADDLRTMEDIAAYLEAAMGTAGDGHARIAQALDVLTRALNMTALVHEVGMTQTELSRDLPGRGNLSLSTMMTVTKELSLQVSLLRCQKWS